MNYCGLHTYDIANGPGCRVSLFVSGCRNRCPGCFQPETWAFDYGEPFTGDTLAGILEALEPSYIDGLTILGGDPMEPENVQEVTRICTAVKARYIGKTIWIYTGYLYEAVKDSPALARADVLVDGPFIASQKVLGQFRGSGNQRIINLSASRRAGRVVLWRAK